MSVLIQRYAKRTADNYPFLEVSSWVPAGTEGTAIDDPRKVPLPGQEGEWVCLSVAGAFADLSGLFSEATVDPVTGVVLDPGGAPLTELGLSALLDLPLRDGLELIDRDEFEELWPPPEPDDESPGDESPGEESPDEV